jgi:hypothetical protein
MEKLELRMYGFVPYNISEIQKGIQFGHTVVEYGLVNHLDNDYLNWAKYNKTFIILNGGTSNHSVDRYREEAFNKGWREDETYVGSMETIKTTLEENDVKIATFYEPDLNDMLSGICFIVDERVFNKKYLGLGDWIVENYGDMIMDNHGFGFNVSRLEKQIKYSEIPKEQKIYQKWVEYIGGEKNVFLRDYLSKFRLA